MRKIFLALIVLLAALPLAAASKIEGLWDAVLDVNGLEISFRFEIAQNGKQVQGFFFEGDRKVGSTSGSFENGTLKLGYDYLGTVLEATLDGGQLRGTYGSNEPNARPMNFHAHRFAPAPVDTAAAPQIAGSWEMRRVAEEAKEPRDSRTWYLYLRQSGSEVSGSILRVSGDTGMLTGRWQNGTLVLSHFAGDRPNLLEAQLKPDGTLAITLNRNAHYLGVRTSEAQAKGIPEPPDPSRYTSVKDPTAPFHFSFPDLNGKVVSDTDKQFQGKVVLLSIGGTWCPNCRDEAPFLVELYKEFHSRGLEVVGLMFESDDDPAVVRPQVMPFIKHYGIPYTVLVAGTPDQVNQRLPMLVNFGSYPTSIFLSRDGRVQSVHAGFPSVATGEEHVKYERETRALIRQLLAENPRQGSSNSSSGR